MNSAGTMPASWPLGGVGDTTVEHRALLYFLFSSRPLLGLPRFFSSE